LALLLFGLHSLLSWYLFSIGLSSELFEAGLSDLTIAAGSSVLHPLGEFI